MTSNVKQLEPTDLHRRFAYNDKQTLLALYEQLALEDIPPQSLMASISTAVLFNNLILSTKEIPVLYWCDPSND